MENSTPDNIPTAQKTEQTQQDYKPQKKKERNQKKNFRKPIGSDINPEENITNTKSDIIQEFKPAQPKIKKNLGKVGSDHNNQNKQNKQNEPYQPNKGGKAKLYKSVCIRHCESEWNHYIDSRRSTVEADPDYFAKYDLDYSFEPFKAFFDPSLSPLGVKQTEVLGQNLSQWFLKRVNQALGKQVLNHTVLTSEKLEQLFIKKIIIFVSPMVRCLQTIVLGLKHANEIMKKEQFFPQNFSIKMIAKVVCNPYLLPAATAPSDIPIFCKEFIRRNNLKANEDDHIPIDI